MATKVEVYLEEILQAPKMSALQRQSHASLTDSDTNQLATLMTQTKNNYPGQEIPEETLEMWVLAWMALAQKYGIAALRRALQTHMTASRFFPHPADLREQIEAARPTRSDVFVPLARWETAKLCGPEIAARSSEMTVDEVARLYGAQSARLYRAKLKSAT
jgi:hypothetical protein